MTRLHVVSGLVWQRRELTGELFAHLAQADALATSIDALDRTLRLFDPDIQLDAIPALQSRPKPDWALRGEVVRVVMDVLRRASGPVSTADLAEQVHRQRGLEGDVTKLHLKRLRKCLDRQKARGTVQAVHVNGSRLWSLVR